MPRSAHPAATLAALIATAAPAFAAPPPPDLGFQFVTIDATNNRPYEGGGLFGAGMQGRGSVPYQYRIATFEVSTDQWLEFVNTIAPLTDDPLFFASPGFWGARFTGVPGRYVLRDDIPNPGRVPVTGFTWREAAMYCNWLHNDRAPTLAAIASGAYDTATFRPDPTPGGPPGALADQAARSPGARYWIPSLDEWLKAVHFDPDAHDPEFPGAGRWWDYPNGTDQPLTPGIPGEGQTSAFPGRRVPPGHVNWDEIPLGAYPDVRTPWGLLDASGGSPEFTESWVPYYEQRFRFVDGGGAGDAPELASLDQAWDANGVHPTSHWGGLRIASDVPSPGSACTLFGAAFLLASRRRIP